MLFIDVDSAPINQLANYAAVDGSSITQEFRFNGETDTSRWVAGFYYLNIDSESDNGLKGPAFSTGEGVGRIAVPAAQRAAREAYEHRGAARGARFPLEGMENLRDPERGGHLRLHA